ncbi:MAG: STAS domain-containing protein [Candidatus Ancaeobacter aquaticus]|nr:STAS domain-containing protein [Candidatus Ancaeobacter aquaticus]
MVHYTDGDEKLICAFSHRLDSVNCTKWEQGLYEKVRNINKPVVFDMTEVNYIASAFLRICIAVSKEIGAENLTVIKVHDNVMKVFRLAGLDRQLKIK